MLHLVFQSLTNNPLLQRIGNDDDVVFFENSIFCLTKAGLMSKEIQNLRNNNVQLYSLLEDIETRGLSKDELVAGIKLIDYLDLVKLTEKNKLIKTWN